MGKFVDVEVVVTSTVVYRLPRPTKAEVVQAMSPDDWDAQDPEGSIQNFLESEGIQDRIQGFRPISVTVDDMEISDVMPSGKGLKSEEARPLFQLKMTLTSGKELWFLNGRWEREGEIWSLDELRSVASRLRKIEAKRVVEKYSPGGVEHDPSITEIEMIPYQVKL